MGKAVHIWTHHVVGWQDAIILVLRLSYRNVLDVQESLLRNVKDKNRRHGIVTWDKATNTAYIMQVNEDLKEK